MMRFTNLCPITENKIQIQQLHIEGKKNVILNKEYFLFLVSVLYGRIYMVVWIIKDVLQHYINFPRVA